ncbi:ribonuclease domain-containing protein [Streptomyces sp. NBC_01236]|uniref:ribonuclease domain-containing protein n=1 Tax=Streptomyces sp. NBC_01236 TaxID=2903789 RepID=UPI003FA3BE40
MFLVIRPQATSRSRRGVSVDRSTAAPFPRPRCRSGWVRRSTCRRHRLPEGEGKLPEFDSAGNPITYQEWDVNPYVKGVNRGAERLITGSDGSARYTTDHYTSYVQIR